MLVGVGVKGGYPPTGHTHPPTYPPPMDIPPEGTWDHACPAPGRYLVPEIPTPSVDRQTSAKTLPSRNVVGDR